MILNILIGTSIPVWCLFAVTLINWTCLNHGLATKTYRIDPKFVRRIGLVSFMLGLVCALFTIAQVVAAGQGV